MNYLPNRNTWLQFLFWGSLWVLIPTLLAGDWDFGERFLLRNLVVLAGIWTTVYLNVQVLLPHLRPPARQGGNARSLPKHLQKAAPPAPERNALVLAGCETHVCLMQTALELLEEEFDVWVVTDACSSRTERSRDAAFDRLAGAGCELVTTEMVAFEWLRTAEHPLFKDVLTLVK